MATVNAYQAKVQLSQLLRRAQDGEEIIIANAGVPIVRLVPVQSEIGRSRLGLALGAFVVPDDFNETLLDEY
jgi:prevent-host-death family protein